MREVDLGFATKYSVLNGSSNPEGGMVD